MVPEGSRLWSRPEPRCCDGLGEYGFGNRKGKAHAVAIERADGRRDRRRSRRWRTCRSASAGGLGVEVHRRIVVDHAVAVDVVGDAVGDREPVPGFAGSGRGNRSRIAGWRSDCGGRSGRPGCWGSGRRRMPAGRRAKLTLYSLGRAEMSFSPCQLTNGKPSTVTAAGRGGVGLKSANGSNRFVAKPIRPAPGAGGAVSPGDGRVGRRVADRGRRERRAGSGRTRR